LSDVREQSAQSAGALCGTKPAINGLKRAPLILRMGD
jgi:hypothetical protein